MITKSDESELAPETYYQRIGGAPAIHEAVRQLYERILSDGELTPYFADVDVERVKQHMTLLLTKVLGGPDEYLGRDLDEAHAGLGITGAHYDRVADHLSAVLRGLGVDEDIRSAVAATVAAVRDQIVS